MPASTQQRDSPARRHRKRRPHHRTDSNGELLGSLDDDRLIQSSNRYKHRNRDGRHRRDSTLRASENSAGASTRLSSGHLAQLDKLNQQLGWNEYYDSSRRHENRGERESLARAEHDAELEREREERRIKRLEHRERRRKRREEERESPGADAEPMLAYDQSNSQRRTRREKSRVVSGPSLEKAQSGSRYYNEKEEYREDVRLRGGGSGATGRSSDTEYDVDERRKKRRKRIILAIGILVLALIIIIPVAIVVSKKNSSGSDGTDGGAPGDNSSRPSNSNLDGISESDIPQVYQGTWLDPFTWYDTTDFNVTFTAATVGGLSIMGLNSSWDDSAAPNANVPPLNQAFQYGTMPIRGINIGGWLSIEPFITPSLFSQYSTHDNVVDEYTLSQTLGPENAKSTIEQHYSAWVQESTFSDIQAAGFDHIRIPFSYWAVITYEGDPYVANISWRYLLRGIEWARKYGLRINLDLHGAPGSQNGWNHSGRQGLIGWLNGTDGALNGQRTIDIHKQLSTFFTQPRYQNIVTMYGLVNEPRMVELDTDTVLTWTQQAIDAVRGNNFTGIVVFGDGFMGLNNWQGKLQGNKNLLLDAHQYVVFNVDQIALNHHDKINFACGGWTSQALQSENTATGFGPTLCGEWSQADTDCTQYLNNVGVGSRWEGTLNMVSTPGTSSSGSVLTPSCPTDNNPPCSCDGANADPSAWSADYKQWLLMFAEAQMHSFEQGWGWFYWTWETETAAQWSYKAGLAAGTMPTKAYQRSFGCNSTIPDFSGLSETY